MRARSERIQLSLVVPVAGDDTNGSISAVVEGGTPIITSVEIYDVATGSGPISSFSISQSVYVHVLASDSGLDIEEIVVEDNFPSDFLISNDFNGPFYVSAQENEEELYILGPLRIPGFAGDWRLDVYAIDSQGNQSEPSSLFISISQ